MGFLSLVNPGKPSISMGHQYHGYVSHNQRVVVLDSQPTAPFGGFSCKVGPQVTQGCGLSMYLTTAASYPLVI